MLLMLVRKTNSTFKWTNPTWIEYPSKVIYCLVLTHLVIAQL